MASMPPVSWEEVFAPPPALLQKLETPFADRRGTSTGAPPHARAIYTAICGFRVWDSSAFDYQENIYCTRGFFTWFLCGASQEWWTHVKRGPVVRGSCTKKKMWKRVQP